MSECALERLRGQHDIYNTMASGCIAGATLSFRGGPAAAAFGCGGFAAFSVVIEHLIEPKDPRGELVHAMPTDDDKEEDLFKGSWIEKKYLADRLPELVDVEEEDDLDEEDD